MLTELEPHLERPHVLILKIKLGRCTKIFCCSQIVCKNI